MPSKPDWLPGLVRFENFDKYDNKYEAYFNALYDIFKKDFIDNTPNYRGKDVGLLSRGASQGKDNNFWHIVTKKDSNIPNLHKRPPNIRRCERIRWPRSIIEHAPDRHILVWTEPRTNNFKEHLWLKNFDYVVVLIDKKEYYLFLTAFYVDSKHYREKLQKRYNRYK